MMTRGASGGALRSRTWRMPTALCAAALLLTLLRPADARASAAAAAASGGGAAASASSDAASGSFAPLLDSSSAALAERNALRSLPGVLALRGTTLSCADIIIGQTGTDLSDMGDGFANLDAGEAGALDVLIQGLSQLGENGTFALSSSQLGGANVWLLQHIADMAGVGVTYDSVVLPAALSVSGNRSAQVAYLFDTLGYDCLISATPVQADLMPFADYLLPNEQYGLSVVTMLVPGSDAPILTVLFSWTSPFSKEIWFLIAASLVFGAAAMYVFEGHDRHEDYGAADLMILLRIGRGCYKAFMNFCAVGGFTPQTPASQTFNIAFAFAMLLLQATYTANLAAYFVGVRNPVGAVTSMASFGSKQLAACVMPDPYIVRFIRSNYPLTALVVMPSFATTSDLMDAVLNGTCAGGVASNLALRYAMGTRDAAGSYCDMQLVGPLMSQGFMAVPFNRATVGPAAMAAMNAIAASAYSLGDYATGASVVSFAEERPYCSAGVGLSTAAPLASLTLTQVSGIFFVLLFGAIVAAGVYGVFHFHAKLTDQVQLEESGGGDDKGGARGDDMVSREEAVSALCAAVARETAVALQVPPRVAAAAERARAERGAVMHATLQLVDVDGGRYGKAYLAELVHAPDWLFLLTRLSPDDALRMGSAVRALAAGAPPPGKGGDAGPPSALPSGDPSALAKKPPDPWAYFASVNGGGGSGGAAGRPQQQWGPAPMSMPSFRTGLNNVASFFRLPSPAAPRAAVPTPAPSSRSLAPSEAPSAAATRGASVQGSRSRSRRAASAAASEPASAASKPRASSSVVERQSPPRERERPRASSTGVALGVRRPSDEGGAPPRSARRSATGSALHAAPEPSSRADEPASPRSLLAGFSRSRSTPAARIPHFEDDLV